jgi:predicted dehydrogenase
MSAWKVGISGLGAIRRAHLAPLAAHDRFLISVVHDADSARAAGVAREVGCTAAESFEALLATRPDVVVLLLPHDLHSSHALEALDAGCHVLVEKPMANSVEECCAMLRAAERADRVLRVADLSSYLPGAVETGRRFAAGDLGGFLSGAILNARFYFTDSRPAWFLDPERSGGGMFSNVGLHRLAEVRTVLPGLAPRTVDAAVTRLDAWQVEACTSALVRYDRGAMHYEEVGYFPRPDWFASHTHFYFERGLVAFDHDAWRLVDRDGAEETVALPAEPGYAPVYDDLAEALDGGLPRGPSARDSAGDVALVRAMYESGRTGRQVALAEEAFTV